MATPSPSRFNRAFKHDKICPSPWLNCESPEFRISRPTKPYKSGKRPPLSFGPDAAMSNNSFGVVKGKRSSNNKVYHMHQIEIDGDKFTVDGGEVRDMNNPLNAVFLETIRNRGCPEEFEEDGIHMISVGVGGGISYHGPKEPPFDRRAQFEPFDWNRF
ncbi:Plant UBX domain-containing protein 4 [Ranunculus cassubicifolius]